MSQGEMARGDRITVEALKYYVPYFQRGCQAEALLAEGVEDPGFEQQLRALVELKELTVEKIARLCGPLMTRELNKLIAGSHLKNEDLFDLLYYAGLDGMRRGLRKFDVEKLNASSTNYLFQWIVTYAKKELGTLEAPFGIPPSRFQRYKKIAAVRKKLTAAQGSYATNEQVYAYFQSGQADLKTMNGRVQSQGKPSQANKNITLELVAEQEDFEKNMMTVSLLDTTEAYTVAKTLQQADATPFVETAFGIFLQEYDFTTEARCVLMSELNYSDFTEEEAAVLQALSPRDYKALSTQWKNLVKDVKGPFYAFLRRHRDAQFSQFDTTNALKHIEGYEKAINSSSYMVLFQGGKMRKHG